MSPAHDPIHLFVVDSDAAVAQAVVALALGAFPPDAETVVAKSTSVEGARRLIDRVRADEDSVVIVVCATELADGGRGLDVLRHVKQRHARTRVVLITNGERNELAFALEERPDGIVMKPNALKPLRAILAYLSREHDLVGHIPPTSGPAVEVIEPRELRDAVAAMETALEAVERAQDRLSHALLPDGSSARIVLKEAETLAIGAHRRVLEAERKLLGSAAPSVKE